MTFVTAPPDGGASAGAGVLPSEILRGPDCSPGSGDATAGAPAKAETLGEEFCGVEIMSLTTTALWFAAGPIAAGVWFVGIIEPGEAQTPEESPDEGLAAASSARDGEEEDIRRARNVSLLLDIFL